jgi:pSer/pThr/pTyr-binding forkhead associated (FHA) protein
VFGLSTAATTVGREMGCDIVLGADPTVSRLHARIAREGVGFVLYDNGSSNGTFVNGQRVRAPVPLAPGDAVQFGATRFHFE